MIPRLALILLLIAPNWAGAEGITTQQVLDGYEEDNLYLAYVSGVLRGLTIYDDLSQTTLGSSLYCRNDASLTTDDFVTIIKGEVAQANNALKQELLQTSFDVVALVVMQRIFPCE